MRMARTRRTQHMESRFHIRLRIISIAVLVCMGAWFDAGHASGNLRELTDEDIALYLHGLEADSALNSGALHPEARSRIGAILDTSSKRHADTAIEALVAMGNATAPDLESLLLSENALLWQRPALALGRAGIYSTVILVQSMATSPPAVSVEESDPADGGEHADAASAGKPNRAAKNQFGVAGSLEEVLAGMEDDSDDDDDDDDAYDVQIDDETAGQIMDWINRSLERVAPATGR